MKPQVLLVAVAALAVLAALPLAESKGHGIGEHAEAATASAWPCCDTCGSCTRSIPPQCLCEDEAPGGCHPECRNCVKSTDGGSDVFRCADRITNFCKRRCTPAASA
ncbi:Bowman-Birk type trypsin inhibitor-like [Panicum virgatum]|uniref:Bowman-Birk serine protease inhibitors family domain-containing protein n=1 Tax=Panicum virgatum TaxID=38727 RepID=A0A8T0T0S9_PANVG|nr:Bowman-Birk type trypsin inhibitor-like [Panicum virgatum]KAG2601929.1 hypothetical protein PVAP13_5KG626900 [Panicum virgatum]